MARWRLHTYWQGGDEPGPERSTLAEVRADLERVGPEEDWVYIERLETDGAWAKVAFAGESPDLPDAWDYEGGDG